MERTRLEWRRVCVMAAVTAVVWTVSSPATAQWSRLPAATDRLENGAVDDDAERVVERCAEQIRRTVADERLDLLPLLAETWMASVAAIPDGEVRQAGFADQLARELAAVAIRAAMEGRSEISGPALARAVEIGPSADVMATARRLFLPPSSPKPGQPWRSLVDDAEFTWHPELQYRLGCTDGDTQCARNEIFFRWVTVPGLWVQTTEVTRSQYHRCVEAGGCLALAGPQDREHADLPIAWVTWPQARAYATWAGRRLPSEAEFERAARGETTRHRFPWGSRFDHDRANTQGVSGADRFIGAAPVGSFPATALGVNDIVGNVWEWCADTYHPNAVGAPTGPEAWVSGGMGRVVRGGSFTRDPQVARVSVRSWQEEDHRARDIGFRTVVSGLDAVTDAWLIRRLTLAFPPTPVTSALIETSGLAPEDRLFLTRRALTWYVIEGRPEEALELALTVLDADGSDRVALDLLDRIEDRVTGWTVVGRLEELEQAIRLIRRHALPHPRHGRRFRTLLSQVAQSLEEGGTTLLARGRHADARARFTLAVLADPSRRSAAEARQGAEPDAGHRWTSPGDGREMVWIPTGSFVMGASPGDTAATLPELPAHRRRVEGFWMDRREVTNAEYRRCVDAGACTPPGDRIFFDHPNFTEHPVVFVDWRQARSYAVWAGKRLPSEAEWEYAARAGSQTRYPWGDAWEDGRANAAGALEGDRWGATAPVGQFQANPWGIHDLVGNVAEWVADRWHRDLRGAPADARAWTDLVGPLQPPLRVVRGGSFESSPNRLRVSRRDDAAVDWADRAVGFRCAAD